MAVALGGVAPYSFQWGGGGSGDAGMQVCPATTTTYKVTVTDSSGSSGEVNLANAHVSASVTVAVDPEYCASDAGLDGANPEGGNCQSIFVFSSVPAYSDSGLTPFGLCQISSATSYTADVPLKKGQDYELILDNFTASAVLGTPFRYDYYGTNEDCYTRPQSESQFLGSLTEDPMAAHQSFCFHADADYPRISWWFDADGGLPILESASGGTLRLCGGCGRGSAP
jgi:hypothetical protein